MDSIRKDKKVLFICTVYPAEIEDTYYMGEYSGYQAAAISWQWNFIKGIEHAIGDNLDLLSGVLIPQYSSGYKKLYFKGMSWAHTSQASDYCIPFMNIFPVKNVLRQMSIARKVREWLVKNRDSEMYVIAYSPHVPFIGGLKTAKRHNAITCAIIPDLPEFAGLPRMKEALYRMLKKHDVRAFYRYANNVDKFVFLTEHMKEKFRESADYVVVEGMCDPTAANYEPYSDTAEKVVLYSGSIMRQYGILQLLSAFECVVERNIRLVICGEGDAKPEVVKASHHDRRIEYLGSIPHAEALKLQRDATVLINPRGVEGEYTKYSFPSKIIEYMLAAKPVLCCKLAGIPKEYDDYLIYLEDNSPEEIAKKISSVCRMDYMHRRLIGERARDFVVARKSYVHQCAAIAGLLGVEQETGERLC